jgi:hypothetical protein
LDYVRDRSEFRLCWCVLQIRPASAEPVGTRHVNVDIEGRDLERYLRSSRYP